MNSIEKIEAVESYVESLPNHEVTATDEDCIICMENLTMGMQVKVLPCKHAIHTECLKKWMVETQTCPYCREVLLVLEPRLPRNVLGTWDEFLTRHSLLDLHSALRNVTHRRGTRELSGRRRY